MATALGRAALALFVLCAVALPDPGFAQRSIAEGFRSMELQTARKPHGYARVAFPDGSRGERFILKSGDCPRSTGDCRADRERIEFFETSPRQRVGSDVWVGWSVMLDPAVPTPPSRNDRNITLGQFHQWDDSGPELMFTLRNNGLELVMKDPYRLDDDPMRPIPDFRNRVILPLGALRGRFARILVNARWSRGADGYIRVFANGRQVFDYAGATTNSNAPLYFKYGVYRSFVSRCGGPCPTLTAYYRDVKRGSTRAEVE